MFASWCDCGQLDTYSTLPSRSSETSVNCDYTSTDPAKRITPISTTAAPTNIPGMNGVDQCRPYAFDNVEHPDCPYALDGWCDCEGITVEPLKPTESDQINCAYTVLPTVNGGCPVNTEYSVSVSKASAASQSSREAAASSSKAAAPQPSPSPSPDWNSEACKSCGSDLGASDCAAANTVCLVSECKGNKNCQICGVDCQAEYGDPPNDDPPDMNSEACKECMSDMGASDCPADDDACLVDQCKHDSWCMTCRMDCDTYGNI